jgi:hypothetical protein
VANAPGLHTAGWTEASDGRVEEFGRTQKNPILDHATGDQNATIPEQRSRMICSQVMHTSRGGNLPGGSEEFRGGDHQR